MKRTKEKWTKHNSWARRKDQPKTSKFYLPTSAPNGRQAKFVKQTSINCHYDVGNKFSHRRK